MGKIYISGEIKAILEDIKESINDGVRIYVLTGEYGAGKSTALGVVEERLKKARKYAVVRIEPYERLTLWGLVRWIMREFGRKPRQSVQDVAKQFKEMLYELHRQGKRLIILVDNGQLLTPKAWLVLKILTTDLRHGDVDISAFAIVAGNIERTDLPEEVGLRAEFFRMQGFDEEDARGYIRWRAPELPAEVIEEIVKETLIPVRINREIREKRRQLRRYGRLRQVVSNE